MEHFVRVSALVATLLALVGCGAPTPTASSPRPAGASAAPPQLIVAPAATKATSLPPTLTPVAPSPTTLPSTAALASSSPTSQPPTAVPQARGWSEIVAANDGPPARYDHSAVLDPVRQQLVVFGGRDKQALGDTWIFDLATRRWREVPATGPEPRFGHGAAYEAAHRRMLIVMGQGADFFNDVWAFDLDKESWTQLIANDRSAISPRPRYGQSAALDGQGRVLISHGFSDQGRFDDTWAFNLAAARWVNLTPASGPKPLKRCLHELIYEATADRLLLFGGCSSGFGPCPQGDLWAFDLKTTTWTELMPNGAKPAARSNASLIYQSTSQTLFLFGGKTADGANAETWSYHIGKNEWTHLEGQAPPAHAAARPPAMMQKLGVF
jgi:Galactose oxidase, central domain